MVQNSPPYLAYRDSNVDDTSALSDKLVPSVSFMEVIPHNPLASRTVYASSPDRYMPSGNFYDLVGQLHVLHTADIVLQPRVDVFLEQFEQP